METTISELHELTGLDRRTIKRRISSLQPVRKIGRAIMYDCPSAIEAIYSEKRTPQHEKARLGLNLGNAARNNRGRNGVF